MDHVVFCFPFFVVLSATFHLSHAVEYSVTNTASSPGGARFNNEIGDQFTLQALSSASEFIWRVFQQPNEADRKNVQKVSFFVDDGIDVVAYAINNEIHFSASYINGYSGDLKNEFSGVVYHEMTHIWQWNGSGQAPSWLIEGIADFVRLRGGYVPSHWVKPGGGTTWTQGYDVTAQFLDYCNSLSNGFVAQLNGKMATGYTDQFFVDLLGKSVDQLWNEYKAKYGN